MKHLPFCQFSSKLSEIFLVEDLANWVLVSSYRSFWADFFLLGYDAQKMDDHFQHPLWPSFITLSTLATILENGN